jgi:CheY-like chemotaxis protein
MSSPKRRILCVDDDCDTCQMLTHLLAHANYEAQAVMNVEEALALAQRQSFNLYILDARFPDGKGLSLCSQIRQFDPHTPIIVYSGAVYDSDREEAERAGATAFVPKPDVDLLIETVSQLLS